ncbi:hypothetical protein [Sulfitobacter sp.]|jgi:hypothetical protein|uniref:hypothetical protein n=1 Tax=Sulfitobacter sp. TaxID=1903071 RepID=UPI003072C36F
MSYQTTFTDLFDPARPATQTELPLTKPTPATQKQIDYALSLAEKTKSKLPAGITQDRTRLSKWIDAHKPAPSAFNDYPSSKQVGFAERIARLKRTQVPPECFRDRGLMSRWIDGNKPR